MTAEEILRKHTRAILSGANLTKANALKAMEEFASLKVNEVKDQWVSDEEIVNAANKECSRSLDNYLETIGYIKGAKAMRDKLLPNNPNNLIL